MLCLKLLISGILFSMTDHRNGFIKACVKTYMLNGMSHRGLCIFEYFDFDYIGNVLWKMI